MQQTEERGHKCPSLMEECFVVLQEGDGLCTLSPLTHQKKNPSICAPLSTALDTEGIFRLSASTLDIERLKTIYNCLHPFSHPMFPPW